MRQTSEAGFTLIELLSVLAIIGILSSLGITSFRVYQANAAYAVASDTIRNAQTAFEAGINDIDDPPGNVGLTQQTTQGQITNASAANLLPGMMLPKNVSFQVQYDPTCTDAGCQSALVQVNHCLGEQYVRWVRFGDGLGVLLENLDGEGCS